MNPFRDRFRAFWSDSERRRTFAWLFGVLAVLALLYGGYTFLEAHNRYTELNATVEKLGPPADPNDPSNVGFALMLRDRDKAENRRWQGVMFMGLGLIGLGLAYLSAPGSLPGANVTAAMPRTEEPPRDPPPP